ncbi:MAG: low molecular weight phosphatase family protein [Pseudomonadota bacterium]
MVQGMGQGMGEGPKPRTYTAGTLPGAVLFCCNQNQIRSPYAEGLLKQLHGRKVFVQSCGVRESEEVDPFMAVVAAETGIDIAKHRPRSFDEMEAWGDDITGYDLIVALSPAAQRHALERTRAAAVDIEYWPVLDPSGIGESREQKLDAYRQTRDQILGLVRNTFGG